MQIKAISFLIFGLSMPAVAVSNALSESLPSRPNIILFLADDMGWGDSQVLNSESKIDMPNLERLAAEGISFSNAHATPKCAPTRYSLISGNYPSRGRHSWGAWEYMGGSQILPGQLTIANVMRDNGYNTGVVGKWHMGGDLYIKNSESFAPIGTPEAEIDFARGLQNGPLSHGFNYSYIALRGIQAPPYVFFEDDQLTGDPDSLITWPKGLYGNSLIPKPGIGAPDWDSSQVGPRLMQQAIAFIDGHQQQNIIQGTEQPFFLYYPAQAAHGPLSPPEFFLGEPVKDVTGLGLRTDMVYELDVALGKLLEALETRELSQNTLIIFVSDNGAPSWRGPLEEVFNHEGNGVLRGVKGEIWEGAHRVPLIAKWGDGSPAGSIIPPGAQSGQLIATKDLFATLAAVVEAPLPATQAVDSFNFLPVLLGQQSENIPVRDFLIEEARELSGFHVPPLYALVDKSWKLIFDFDAEAAVLINLDTDLSETINLIDDPAQAQRIARMKERFFQLAGSDRSAPLLLNDSPPLKERYDFVPGVDEGVFLWKETFDGPYYLVVNGTGSTAEYELEILASQAFGAVSGFSIDAEDTLDWNENRLYLKSQVSNLFDAVGFIFPPRTTALLTLKNTDSNQSASLYTGAGAHHLQPGAWRIASSQLPVLPAFTPGVSLGLFFGKDSAGQLSTRWSGDGANHQVDMTLYYSEPNPGVSTESFEAGTDLLNTTDYSASVTAHIVTGEDGVDVMLTDPNTEIGISYYHDGGVRTDLINPGTAGLGLPNAFRLPRAEAIGRPAYDVVTDTGVFVWKDEQNIWYLRAAAGVVAGQYTGIIRSSLPVVGAAAFMLETDDVITLSDDSKELTFDFQVLAQSEDGFDFLFPADAVITLELNDNSATAATLVSIGAAGWPLSQLPVDLTR